MKLFNLYLITKRKIINFFFILVCGVIGVLQALEAIKLILNLEETLSGRMLLFDGYDTTFRCIKLRKKKLDCDICGINPKIKHLMDYEQFCGSSANDKVSNKLHTIIKFYL